jgi:hypothetical protein
MNKKAQTADQYCIYLLSLHHVKCHHCILHDLNNVHSIFLAAVVLANHHSVC